MKSKIILILFVLTSLSVRLTAQVNVAGQDTSRRVITTAVPYLTIAPDARAGGMGDVGAATSPDVNAQYWNIAKLAFIEKDYGFAVSYTPWLKKIIDDMSLSYLSGFYKINKEQAVGISLSYFDLGQIQFTDEFGQELQDFRPREFSFSGSYSRLLSEEMSVGVTLRYIHSNLTGNVYTSTDDSQAGVSLAADLGWFWNKEFMTAGKPSNIAIGATITNIGSKITYSNDEQREFIPTNLRIGTAYKLNVDPYNSFTFALDFNKLMVPTPPVYELNEDGSIATDPDGNKIIARGKDPDRPLLSGMFGSFADAPDGFSEEMQEIMIATGLEYWYKDLFSARAGYFYEHFNKGNRKYFTLGLGLRYNVFGIDFAYLVPTQNEHPLGETLRFSLLFNFDSKKRQESITDDTP
jgi:hypothetical protein